MQRSVELYTLHSVRITAISTLQALLACSTWTAMCLLVNANKRSTRTSAACIYLHCSTSTVRMMIANTALTRSCFKCLGLSNLCLFTKRVRRCPGDTGFVWIID
jgi:hypothetical protein